MRSEPAPTDIGVKRQAPVAVAKQPLPLEADDGIHYVVAEGAFPAAGFARVVHQVGAEVPAERWLTNP